MLSKGFIRKINNGSPFFVDKIKADSIKQNPKKAKIFHITHYIWVKFKTDNKIDI
jgi:hypothetical protein